MEARLFDQRRCPACGGSSRPLRMRLRRRYQLLRCQECRTQFFVALDGSPDTSEYWSDPYKFEVYTDEAVRRDLDARYRRVLHRVRESVGTIRSVVDLGCGVGNFVEFAARQGWEAVGFDVDADAVKAARARGLRATDDDAELDRMVPGGSADVGTLWDVIEHLSEPRPLLRRALSKVRPGGALVIETPDASFPLRPVLRALRWASGGRIALAGRMYYWEHKVYFTRHGLERLLGEFGCVVEWVGRENSPRVKMARLWEQGARQGRPASQAMVRAWPWLDRATRAINVGNKIVLVARTTSAPSGEG
jgi:SAM-dependent methyltransferase